MLVPVWRSSVLVRAEENVPLADLALVDPEKPWVVDSARMAASAGNTPFDRQPVQGRVTALWKGGVPVGV